MRRVLVVLLGILVLLAGGIAAVVVYRLHQEGNIRGSSTEEFTLPTTTAKPVATPLHVSWPQYGFDATRDRSVQLALRPPFRKVWRYYAGSLVEFPPAIAYGRLYFSTNSGKVTAISTKTGRRAWIYRSRRCAAASPAVGTYKHGTVYAVFLNKPPCNASSTTGTGKVIAFAAGFGEPRWSKTIGPSESSPLLVGNRLYVGDWDGRLWALDARTGKTLWSYRTHGPIKGAAAFADGRVYVGSYDGHVYCLGAQKGRLVWKAKAQPRLYGRSRFYSTPALAYGRVYIGSTDGRVYSYGAATGKLIWSHSTGGYVYSSPAAWNGLVFVGSYSKRFYALDGATGDERWSFPAKGQISGSATVIGNVVYFATLKPARTYALSARGGKLLWTYPDGEYTPVVAEPGRLFLIGSYRLYGMVPR
jgi:outer membrane protein assembly factor BamB